MTVHVGFDLNTQKLLCFIVLNDAFAEALGFPHVAFFRAFIVQDRDTGEILMKQRFRHTDGKSWQRIRLDPERQKQSRAERVAFLQETIEGVLRAMVSILSPDGAAPKDTVRCHYPPNPDGEPQETLDWLIAEDLVTVTRIERTEDPS